MSKAHYDAFEAMLPDTLNIFRGSAPSKPVEADYPYVVLGGNAGADYSESATGKPDAIDLRFKLTYAGLSFDQLLVAIEQVRAAFRGKRLVVPGWSSAPFRHEPLVDIRTDRDITVPGLSINPVYAVDELAVFSTR
ncbi:hypothetical protein [Arthrobacter sp. UYCu712]|uniref:hypothetical protein n=1 Tax=Arthrobacter sp. UYCu712 TaxID=3156340 RepID=UPI00339497B3